MPSGMPVPRAHPAHAMAQVHPVDAARTLHRTVVDREHHGVTLAQRHDLGPRLHARTLLGHDELAAGEVAPRLGQQDRQLQRKHVLAVEVLMQAVVVAGTITAAAAASDGAGPPRGSAR